ncbi:MAG: hypothetical protein LHV68_07020 [Elusimicrobia bacterium]|nr:hypothetical protein [Candidatus Liberimonas magnetica]
MKELCLKLAQAVSEDEIEQIINNDCILRNNENWRRYGSINNIGTVTGQSPQAVPSLVEKITNYIDALLIKACKDHGDNPESPISPKSMIVFNTKLFTERLCFNRFLYELITPN